MSSTKQSVVERIYVLDGGTAHVTDRSVYSPGVDVGQPVTLSCNAYLIRRSGDWLLWDTGIEDDVVRTPEGRIIAHGIRGIVTRTIASQLADIGIRPSDIGTVALSHGHFDHVGNVGLFPGARWILQRAEHEALFGPDAEDFGYVRALYQTMEGSPVELLDGDADLFGDGSVRVIATPGHTLGHSSLLVRLPQTGPVLLSGDVAHFRSNLEHRRVPVFNVDAGQSRASMEKVAALVEAEGAQLWINHDVEQSATIPHAPRWIE